MKKTTVKVSSLVEVPELKSYYSEQPISELVESIKREGLKVPIIISSDNEIIDGYRRFESLKALGIEDVDVLVDEVKPEIDEHVLRNMYRKKTAADEVKDLRSIFKRYPKRQGKRNNGQPYSRSEQISNATKNRWKDETVLNKLEFILNNDLKNDFLAKSIIENKEDVESCFEFLNTTQKIDTENNYGYHDKMIKGIISVKEANKFINQTYSLDKRFEPTFSIPERCNMYLQDCREVQKLSDYYKNVDVLATSIPYYQLENYVIGEENQIGHEETKEKYLENITDIINKQIPLLKDTANVFLNISETYQEGIR